eukprot:TRINITY_DN16234_c0_g1_i2.p2 TRINITY_DN16234_c0_g1~~TRINITY_DN16234_c0_g1_i2.p2  ORF type:complete len:239 (+),score=19.43 TRINITY_DN16234_c0_g1_i2:701-1417(+)
MEERRVHLASQFDPTYSTSWQAERSTVTMEKHSANHRSPTLLKLSQSPLNSMCSTYGHTFIHSSPTSLRRRRGPYRIEVALTPARKPLPTETSFEHPVISMLFIEMLAQNSSRIRMEWIGAEWERGVVVVAIVVGELLEVEVVGVVDDVVVSIKIASTLGKSKILLAAASTFTMMKRSPKWGLRRLTGAQRSALPVSYTHLRAHETPEHLVCRLLLEKKKKRYVVIYMLMESSTLSKS